MYFLAYIHFGKKSKSFLVRVTITPKVLWIINLLLMSSVPHKTSFFKRLTFNKIRHISVDQEEDVQTKAMSVLSEFYSGLNIFLISDIYFGN